MNLESRLLDGKPAGYCSSSEGEEEDFKVVNDDDTHQANVMKQFGPSANTGAKGVLNDFKAFREQARYAVEMKNQAFLDQAKRGMMMGSKEEREKAQKGNKEEEELMMSLDELRLRRLRDLKKVAANKMIEITDKNQYSDAVDGSSAYLLCVLIHEPMHEECNRLSTLMKILAADYPKTKFIRATSTLLGMSQAFRERGIPTIQFYKNGELIGNFVRVSSYIGKDYDLEKLRKFLKEQHMDLANGCFAVDSDDGDDELD